MFAGKAEAYQSGAPFGTSLEDQARKALSTNNIQGQEWQTLQLITEIKSLKAEETGFDAATLIG